MKSLAEQLVGCGLASERQFREVDAEQQLNQPAIKVVKSQSVSCERDLDACATMQEFKQTTKAILLDDPQAIHRIIQKAHRFKGDQPENKKFIWFFYQVRAQLNTVPANRQQEFLQKAFRRRGSTLEIE